MQTANNFYELLGVSREASQDDIRKAHRRLVREHHPDANPGDGSAEGRFKEIQQAYEVLSNPGRKQEYDNKLRASSGGSSGSPRARAGGRTREETATTVDLSDLLRKLAGRSGGHEEGSFQLQGEEVARLAKLLGVDISRVSGLLGKDITRLSKLVGEHIKMNAETSFGDARSSGGFSATDQAASAGRTRRVGKNLREKNVKVKKAQSKEKKVKGPKARRRSGSK